MNQTKSSNVSHRQRAAATRRWNVLTAVLLLAAIIAIGALAFATHSTPYFDFDLTITRTAQAFQAPWFDALMRAVGFPGYPPQVYVWIVLVLLLFWFTGRRWEAAAFIFCTLGIGIVGLAIKIPVDRMRPLPALVYVANPQLDGGKYSFPAGHVEADVAIFGYLMYVIWKERTRAWWHIALLILLGVQIALIGISRIYVGEHWFSDVIGAYLVGAVWLWVSIRFYEWGKDRFFQNDQRRIRQNRQNK